MKYKYLYQTKANENCEGWVAARNRAEAYAALRKQGIRPYRLIGDDPAPWRVWALAAAALAAVAAVAAAVVFYAFAPNGDGALRRQQLAGSPAVVSAGLASAWEGVFDSPLDRYLAAYAQPGWIAIPPDREEGDRERFEADARAPSRPVPLPDDDGAVKTLKRIVAGMRDELAGYVAGGGTVDEYLEFLEDRQDDEAAFLRKAREAVASARPADCERIRMNMNVRLREMGLPEVSPAAQEGGF